MILLIVVHVVFVRALSEYVCVGNNYSYFDNRLDNVFVLNTKRRRWWTLNLAEQVTDIKAAQFRYWCDLPLAHYTDKKRLKLSIVTIAATRIINHRNVFQLHVKISLDKGTTECAVPTQTGNAHKGKWETTKWYDRPCQILRTIGFWPLQQRRFVSQLYLNWELIRFESRRK